MGKPVFMKLKLTDIIVHPSKKLLFTCSKNYCLPVHKHCSPVQKIIVYLSRNIVHLSKKCIGSLIFPPRAVSKTAMQFTYYCSFDFSKYCWFDFFIQNLEVGFILPCCTTQVSIGISPSDISPGRSRSFFN